MFSSKWLSLCVRTGGVVKLYRYRRSGYIAQLPLFLQTKGNSEINWTNKHNINFAVSVCVSSINKLISAISLWKSVGINPLTFTHIGCILTYTIMSNVRFTSIKILGINIPLVEEFGCSKYKLLLSVSHIFWREICIYIHNILLHLTELHNTY